MKKFIAVIALMLCAGILIAEEYCMVIIYFQQKTATFSAAIDFGQGRFEDIPLKDNKAPKYGGAVSPIPLIDVISYMRERGWQFKSTIAIGGTGTFLFARD